MLKRLVSLAFAALLASTLTGCGSNPVVNGAAVGGLIGVIAGDTGKAAARGAVAGAVIGGLLGSGQQQQPTVQRAPTLAPTDAIPPGRAICPLPDGRKVWANSYPQCLAMQREVAGRVQLINTVPAQGSWICNQHPDGCGKNGRSWRVNPQQQMSFSPDEEGEDEPLLWVSGPKTTVSN